MEVCIPPARATAGFAGLRHIVWFACWANTVPTIYPQQTLAGKAAMTAVMAVGVRNVTAVMVIPS